MIITNNWMHLSVKINIKKNKVKLWVSNQWKMLHLFLTKWKLEITPLPNTQNDCWCLQEDSRQESLLDIISRILCSTCYYTLFIILMWVQDNLLQSCERRRGVDVKHSWHLYFRIVCTSWFLLVPVWVSGFDKVRTCRCFLLRHGSFSLNFIILKVFSLHRNKSVVIKIGLRLSYSESRTRRPSSSQTGTNWNLFSTETNTTISHLNNSHGLCSNLTQLIPKVCTIMCPACAAPQWH